MLERELGDRFDVVRGMVPYNVAYLGDGRFHKGVAGELFADDRKEMQALAEAIGQSPAALKLSGDMLGHRLGQAAHQPQQCGQCTVGTALVEQLLRARLSPRGRGLAARRAAPAEQAGIEPAKVGAVGPTLLPWVIGSPDWLFRNLFMKAWKIDAKARSSMADDLAAGRKTEVDYINGELVRLAERLGGAAPVNRKIVELIRKAEEAARPGRPPSFAAKC